MVCFSGIGGMIRVGCRLTRVARNEANSEYLRLTSSPCGRISTIRGRQAGHMYAAINGVLDIFHTVHA